MVHMLLETATIHFLSLQAQAAYERDCQQLLDHHSHNLTAASSPTSGGCSGSSTWSWRCIAAELSQLEELVAAGNLQAGVVGAVRSGGSDWSAALHTLMQLATTAGASLEAVEQVRSSRGSCVEVGFEGYVDCVMLQCSRPGYAANW